MKNKTVKSGSLRQKLGAYLGVALLIIGGFASVTHKAYAVNMSDSSVLETNMNAGGASTYYVDFKAGAADPAGTLTITWPAGFTMASGTLTPSTSTCTSIFSGATALPGSLTASGSGQVDTVSSVNLLVSGTQYCVGFTGTNPVTDNASANNYSVTLTDTGNGDTTTVGIDVISSDTIGVSAVVAPSFTLIFGGHSDSFTANLSSTTVTSTGGVGLTVSTNAANGWGLWAEDQYAGLHSTVANKTINTAATGSNYNMGSGGGQGTEAYALGVTTSNATTNYADAAGSTGSGLSTTAYNEIASAATPGSNVTVTVKELADISGTTPAAPDYSDTITIVGDGSF